MEWRGVVIGGLLPAVLYGIAGALQKASQRTGAGIGPYLICIGLAVVGVGAAATAVTYVSPHTTRHGRLALTVLAPLDDGLRRASRHWWRGVARDPRRLARRVHVQSIMFIQPVDFMASGDQSMCDGCPDITVHDGQLVWSCRLEEVKAYGNFLRTVPRREAAAEAAE